MARAARRGQPVKPRAGRLAAWAVTALVTLAPWPAALPEAGAAQRPGPADSAYDLGADERLGGHTLARHVGRTDDELHERLRSQRSIAAASTYSDRSTAERVVADTLRRERRRVERWLGRTGPRPNLALDYRGSPASPIGRTLRRGETRVLPCWDAVVVLRWDGRRGYYVLTSYPERAR